MRHGTQEVANKSAAVIIRGVSLRGVPVPSPGHLCSSQGLEVRNCPSEFWNRTELPETL